MEWEDLYRPARNPARERERPACGREVTTLAGSRYDRNRVLNPLSRRIYRKRIPRAETVAGAAILVLLAGTGLWVYTTADAFDPAERDLSTEALQAAIVEDNLYRAPLKIWTEPGRSGAMAAGFTGAMPGGAAPGPDLGLFPREILDGGWTLDGRVEIYDKDTLFQKIDGAAEQYLAFGFRRLYYVTLAKDGAFVTLEVYDQGDFPGTLGVFAAQREATRALERQGPAYFYRTGVGAIGIAGNHYFKIVGSAETPAVRAKTDALLPLMVKLPGDARPAGLRPFRALSDGLGLPFEAIAFEKSNVFEYEFMHDIWFGSAARDTGDARWFLHEAKDEAAAKEMLGRLDGEQRYEYDAVVQGEASTIYRHKTRGSFFAAARRGALVYGVDGAADRRTAETMLSRLEKELSRG